MRNWNLFLSIFLLTFLLRFYSTYEELKQNQLYSITFISFMFLQYLWGIETLIPGGGTGGKARFYSTYEELKPHNVNIFAILFLCFYSTYEELKL